MQCRSREFPYIKAPEHPTAETPNSRLVDAAANQSIFEFRQTRGTVVVLDSRSYRRPECARFHLHYLTRIARRGHILDFILENATVEMDITSRLLWCSRMREFFGNRSLG
jgi:alpha-acetolactate decarboxylase